MNRYNSTSDAYLDALRQVYFNYQFKSAPRGMPVREIMDYTFTVVNPDSKPIVTNDEDRNDVIRSYTAKETELYDSGTNRVEDFAKASKFWEKLANVDGTVNSAYGYLIWKNRSHGNHLYEMAENGEKAPAFNGNVAFIKRKDECYRTPWEWAKQCLIADKDTRQAIMRFSLPEHFYVGVKDFTCTTHANFLIRDEKLHLTVVMRSNDLMLGLVYDLPWFVSLMDRMIDELKEFYPNLTKGNYTHIAHSMHIYERDEARVLRMLGREAVVCGAV